jgi:hypothetical protein
MHRKGSRRITRYRQEGGIVTECAPVNTFSLSLSGSGWSWCSARRRIISYADCRSFTEPFAAMLASIS